MVVCTSRVTKMKVRLSLGGEFNTLCIEDRVLFDCVFKLGKRSVS